NSRTNPFKCQYPTRIQVVYIINKLLLIFDIGIGCLGVLISYIGDGTHIRIEHVSSNIFNGPFFSNSMSIPFLR
ncbi:hypothetical protein, partial [Streptomyces galilaeus]|uniref:hypothetical protein n=1 Tax=Streptomyces galilaeus TaxID=33899 RepID=UPI0038F648B1